MDNIFIDGKVKANQFTWRKEWIHEFESPWGIIERFKYANNITSDEILKLLGTEKSQKHPLQKSSRDLINVGGLDPGKLMSIIGICFSKQNELFMKQFILPLNSPGFKYFGNNTVFCKECLEIGYHSLFHQFALLHKCPFHLTPLVFGCPHCGLSIPYEINTRLFNYPFTCICGANLFKEQIDIPFFQKWQLTNNLSIQMTEIRHWIKLNDKRLAELTNYFILPSDEQFKSEGLIDLLLPDFSVKSENNCSNFSATSFKILMREPELPPTKIIENIIRDVKESLPNTGQRKITKLIINEYFNFETYRYICLLQIYKAIARNIKKTVLKKHKRCIRSIFVSPSKDCAFALAYIRWRQEIEAIDDPCRVERRRTIIRWPISKIPQHFVHNTLMNCISYTELECFFGCNKSIINSQELWPAATGLYGKLFAHFALNRFYEWLDYAKSLDSLTPITSTLAIPQLETNLPLAVLEKNNDSSSNTLRVYLWNKAHVISK